MHRSSSTVPYPQPLWQCIARVPLPTTPRRCGRPLQVIPTYCPRAMWRCIKGVPLPIAPKHCGSALQEFRSTAPRRCGGALQEVQYPLPKGTVAVHRTSSTAHRPEAVWRCIAGDPYLLPPGSVAVH